MNQVILSNQSFIDQVSVSLKQLGFIFQSLSLLHESPDNYTFKLNVDGKPYALRVPKREKANEGLLFEQELNTFLRLNDFPVPTTQTLPNNWLLQDFLDGYSPEATPQNAEEAGYILAKLHLSTAAFKPQHKPAFAMEWNLQEFGKSFFRFIKPTSEWEQFLHLVNSLLMNHDNYTTNACLLHNDYRRQNLIKTKSSLWVLDFDLASFGSPVKDLAHSLVEWSMKDGDERHDEAIWNSFREGYARGGGRIPEREELLFWIRYACVSDAVGYFIPRLGTDREPKSPLGSYMYLKQLYFTQLLS